MSRYPRVILMVGLAAVLLLACTATIVVARTTYTTSKPVLGETPHKDNPFKVSGSFSPKSTSKNKATIKIVVWMKYSDGWGIMGTHTATVSNGTKYSRTITIPMKGEHGVQARQYRKGKKVSSSGIRYFTVKP